MATGTLDVDYLVLWKYASQFGLAGVPLRRSLLAFPGLDGAGPEP
jgi:hypothetical protein